MSVEKSRKAVRMLVLVGDQIGSNCLSGGKKLSILEKFQKYGWDVTIAGVRSSVQPCPYALKLGLAAPNIDCLVDEIEDVLTFDAVSVLPGPAYSGLLQSTAAMHLIRQAAASGLVVSAWCRGVRVLAEAGVLQGKHVVGHSDDQEIIERSGGIFVGYDHPPVTDGALVTGARSYYYRAKNADAIKKAVDARR
ncbi:MAG: hypothetical protein E4H08_09925 [Candidatus Atribacteria bacterium]|nr:MAG: hypothetical protein E4H08_09925 [Candidatus Atribacteria bacterium]